MLDSVGLVHMNGRVYDQQIGRFISADPFVQDPFDSQSLNRYSYVGNNPLSYTDPSGFFKWTDIFNPSKTPIGKHVLPIIDRYSLGDRILLKNPKWQMGVSAIASLNPWSGMAVNAHLTRIHGGSGAAIGIAGALGYGSYFLNGYFTELFTPAGHAVSWASRTAGAGVPNCWCR